MNAPCPSEIWPLNPVSTLRPISAMAIAHTYANSIVLNRSRRYSGASSAMTMTAAEMAHVRRLKPANLTGSDPHDVSAAEQAAGPHDQHGHDDHEAEREPQVARAGNVG